MALYTSSSGRELEQFHHSVDIRELLLRIDGTGVRFSRVLAFDGHLSFNASIGVKRDGIAITGALCDLLLGHIKMEKAQLEAFVGRANKNENSRETELRITGSVAFRGLEFDVAVTTSFSGAEEAAWTVYADVEMDMNLNRLAPESGGSWLDVELKQVAFIASSTDGAAIPDNHFGYPVRKGIQFCALVDRIGDEKWGRLAGLRRSYFRNVMGLHSGKSRVRSSAEL